MILKNIEFYFFILIEFLYFRVLEKKKAKRKEDIMELSKEVMINLNLLMRIKILLN